MVEPLVPAMSGIVWYGTNAREELIEFYTERIEMDVWDVQPNCQVLNHGSFKIGFCDRPTVESDTVITFLFDTRDEVREMHEQLQDIAISDPHELNVPAFAFKAKDPEGRVLEFQMFDNK
jgi:hypothetical protein